MPIRHDCFDASALSVTLASLVVNDDNRQICKTIATFD